MNLHLSGKVIVVASKAHQNGLDQLVSFLRSEQAIVIGVGEKDDQRGKMETGIWFETHLDNSSDCSQTIQKIVDQYKKVDCLINYSGLLTLPVDDNQGTSTNTTATVNANLVRYFIITHELVALLKKSTGTILNINLADSDTSFEMAQSLITGGRNALTREWAVELLKYNIRVNALIATTSVDYNFTEIASVAAFIISDRSSHTTGQLIEMAGTT